MRVLMLNRRDSTNPEGGGSEIYLEKVAAGLVARGHEVTIFCGAHDRAPAESETSGVRFLRRGSKLGVHREAIRVLREQVRAGTDVIVDVQNGIPFFSPAVTPRTPIVILVHHVHREQWPVVYEPTRAKIGWLLESQVSPRLYRSRPYVAVSNHTKAELTQLGVSPERIEVIENGVDHPTGLVESLVDRPTITVLGRLVPHKQIEHALEAAKSLRSTYPNLRVDIVGDGWWSDNLVSEARRLGVDDITEFHGYVSETRKQELLARSGVLAMPSLKEGWGQVIMEAAAFGVPAVGYRSAGGVADAIVHDETGLLVDDSMGAFREGIDRMLSDEPARNRFGVQAQKRCHEFGWDSTVDQFETLLLSTLRRPRR